MKIWDSIRDSIGIGRPRPTSTPQAPAAPQAPAPRDVAVLGQVEQPQIMARPSAVSATPSAATPSAATPSPAAPSPVTTAASASPLPASFKEIGFAKGVLSAQVSGTMPADGVKKIVLQGVGDVQVLPATDGQISYEAQIFGEAADGSREAALGALSRNLPVSHDVSGGTARITCTDNRPKSGMDALPAWARQVAAGTSFSGNSVSIKSARSVNMASIFSVTGSIIGSAINLGNDTHSQIVMQRDGHTLRIEDGRITFDGREVSRSAAPATQDACGTTSAIVRIPAGMNVEVVRSNGAIDIAAPAADVSARTEFGNVKIHGAEGKVSATAFEGNVEVGGAASLDIGGARAVNASDIRGTTRIQESVGDVTLSKVGDVEMQAADSLVVRGGAMLTGNRISGDVEVADASDVHLTASGGNVTVDRVSAFHIGSTSGNLTATACPQLTASSVGGDLRTTDCNGDVSGRVSDNAHISGGTSFSIGSVGGKLTASGTKDLHCDGRVSDAADLNHVDSAVIGSVGDGLTARDCGTVTVNGRISDSLVATDVRSLSAESVGDGATLVRTQASLGRVSDDVSVDQVTGSIAAVGGDLSYVSQCPQLAVGRVSGATRG